MKRFSNSYYFILAIMIAVILAVTVTSIAPIFAVTKAESDSFTELDKFIDGEEVEEIEQTEEAPAQVKKVNFKSPEPKVVKETVETNETAEETDEVPAEELEDNTTDVKVEKKTETITETTETPVIKESVEEVIEEVFEETLTEETADNTPNEVVEAEPTEIGEPIAITEEMIIGEPIAIPEEIVTIEEIVPTKDYPLIIGELDVTKDKVSNVTCDYFDGENLWHYNADNDEITKLDANEIDVNSYFCVLF